MNVAERIRELRLNKKITVNKLANMAGISQSYLRDLELGKKQPTVEYLSYICDALGITLDAFFTDQKQKDELSALIDGLSEEKKKALIAFLKAIA